MTRPEPLMETISKVVGEVESLTTATNDLARQFTLHRRIVRAMVALVIVLLIGTGFVTWVSVKVSDVSHSINDCITPTGRCYQDQQQRTDKVRKLIIDSNNNGIPDTTEILKRLEEIENDRSKPGPDASTPTG